MSAGKIPAFQFYPADWRKDLGVQSLDFHDRGVWFEMVCLMHESVRRGELVLPNGEPMSDLVISRLIGLDNQNFQESLTRLLKFGVASRDETTGAIICRRMVRDEKLRQIRKNAGKKGGNPILLNQKPNQHLNRQVKQMDEDEDEDEDICTKGRIERKSATVETPKPGAMTFDEFWSRVTQKKGSKPRSKKLFQQKIKSGVDPEAILAGLRAWDADRIARNKRGADQTHINIDTFLANDMWENDYGQDANRKELKPGVYKSADPDAIPEMPTDFIGWFRDTIVDFKGNKTTLNDEQISEKWREKTWRDEYGNVESSHARNER